ncbi:MAG: MFS transporter [Hyphomonadaceae bacterium]
MKGLGSFASAYRSFFAVVAGLTVLQGAMAANALVVALNLRRLGASNIEIGLVAAAFASGFLAGALGAPREILRIGHIRTFVMLAALAAIGALALSISHATVFWALVQAGLGLCCAGLLTAGESWIAQAAPASGRGAVLGFYHLVSKTGAIISPFLVSSVIAGDSRLMMLAAFFCAALLPIAATNSAPPTVVAARPLGPVTIFRIAPAAAVAALCAGAVNNSVAQLYPLYAASIQPEAPAAMAAAFNAMLLIGAMTALWPIGFISDRIDRRLVMGALGSLAAGAALALAVFDPPYIVMGLALVFGAGSLSYYAVAVAHAADRVDPEHATGMMAGILVTWGLGSIAGPLVAGAVMSVGFGPSGLFVFAAFALAGMAAFMLVRSAAREAPVEETKEPFGAAPATSLAIAELDPRGTDEQFELFDPPPEPRPGPPSDTQGTTP